MDLEDAFSAVEHLPSRDRLLIGRGYRPDEGECLDISWAAADIRELQRLRGLEFVSEIGAKLMKTVDDYVAGRRRAVTCISWSDTGMTFIVLGAESPDHVAEMLGAGAEEMVSRHVKGYLSERFSDWKRPLGQVLPFPRRSKD
ncbi:hypothetical protein PQR34_47570 [Paraburkholderia sediminicola]|uniref:hypothetical protein n=1 Tax=Paraburkholderia sediminicola TaxID=458836 RepID=UPI0038BB61C0